MALSAKLELRQSQALVMTPQLQQAIKLLQLSNLELTAFVDAELERNPLLERDEDAPEPSEASSAESPSGESGEDWESEPEPAIDRTGDLDSDYEAIDPEASIADLSPTPLAPAAMSSPRAQGGDGEAANLEEFVAGERTLHDHVREQIGYLKLSAIEAFIAQNLVDMLDDAGYCRGDLDALALRLGGEATLVGATLRRLQALDPPGVFARSLKECLALQLQEQNRYDSVIGTLIDNLELLAQHNVAALKRLCGVDQEELAEMVGEIRRLNPKPGLAFGTTPVETVVPDVIVQKRNDGSWRVELNAETLPRVLINQHYIGLVGRGVRSSDDRTYLHGCLQTANWLVRSLDQRARTILKVAEEIVRQQDGFLSYGIRHLRPLNLKTVADAIGMHESTVSRVTSNKYMATNRGIFELKFFFTSAIASAGHGEAYSSESVRHRIKQMIDAESADDVLSDDKLVERLKSEGMDIARRTVAKYREGMRIASSVQRRRQKRMAHSMAIPA